jgi:hypothetical protein
MGTSRSSRLRIAPRNLPPYHILTVPCEIRFKEAVSPDKKETRQSLADFLVAQSKLEPPIECPHCDPLLLHPIATFFLLESDKTWTLLLSVCPNCDEGNAGSHRSAA